MPALTKLSRRHFLITPVLLAACKPGTALFELSGSTMGTTYSVVARDTSRDLTRGDLQTAIDTALAQVNAQMSNWDANSEISRFNAQGSTAPVQVSAELAEVMAAADQVNGASLGRFDTTIGPLIELWGFGATGQRADAPAEAEIAAAAARAGHGNTLNIASGTLQKQQADAQVYLAAIGKGYGADRVGKALESLGITDYMIEIGGDLYASGRNPDGLPWQIGVETPESGARGLMDVVGVSNLGVASSGDYRNYFEVDGQRFSHVLDPVTGRPITHRTASATVLAENAMLADAWATAMLTLGRARGLEVAQQHDIAVMFIDRVAGTSDLQFETVTSGAFDALRA